MIDTRLFQDFSATYILREIKFGHFEAPKYSRIDHMSSFEFKFLGIFDIFTCEIFPKIKIKSLQTG